MTKIQEAKLVSSVWWLGWDLERKWGARTSWGSAEKIPCSFMSNRTTRSGIWLGCLLGASLWRSSGHLQLGMRPWADTEFVVIYVIYPGNTLASPRRSWKMLLGRWIWNTQLIQLIIGLSFPGLLSLCCHFASFIKTFFLHSVEEGTAVWECFFSGPPSAILCKFKLWIHKWDSSLATCAEAFFDKSQSSQSAGNHKWWQYALHAAALSRGLL